MADNPIPSLAGRWFHRIRSLAIFLFVVWHLFFLLYRNPVDLWSDEIETWLAEDPSRERLNRFYTCTNQTLKPWGRWTGTGQGWVMFGSPLARSGPFPALQIVFEDESEETILSENEFPPEHFFRLGQARQRKLEDHLASRSAIASMDGEEAPLWAAWVLHTFARWKAKNPHPESPPVELRFLTRRWYYLTPENIDHVYPPVEVTTEARYTLEGKRIHDE